MFRKQGNEGCQLKAGIDDMPKFIQLDVYSYTNIFSDTLHRSAKRPVCGCEKFVPALAYLFCMALPGSCLARFAYFLPDLCKG